LLFIYVKVVRVPSLLFYSATWLTHMRTRRNRLLAAIGSVARIADFVAKTGRQRFLDKHAAALLHA
ncbi:MAG: hypothetical protein KBT87_05985, partial [Gammaproteobacteria bacterium]|nr:hypothetical protein [Gammaproteobacteria bacterium]MBQ0774204.1 hypothetical protein [Gammaproteobacteria bacterium]